MSITWAVILTIVLTLFVSYCWFTAQRLHRLQIRTDAALEALEAALDRRAMVVSLVEPSMREFAIRAEAIRLTPHHFAERADNERQIAAAISKMPQPLPVQLVEAEAKVQIAYRFYNDAVLDFRSIRLRPLVRALRLGGNAAIPEFFEYSLFAYATDEPTNS